MGERGRTDGAAAEQFHPSQRASPLEVEIKNLGYASGDNGEDSAPTYRHKKRAVRRPAFRLVPQHPVCSDAIGITIRARKTPANQCSSTARVIARNSCSPAHASIDPNDNLMPCECARIGAPRRD